MCFGCIASNVYWDAAGEDREPDEAEKPDVEPWDLMRDRLRAGLVRLEEDLSAGGPPVRSSQG